MRLHEIDDPLVAHKLTALRDERTDSPTFRRLADELVTLLAHEATRDVPVLRRSPIRTPFRRRPAASEAVRVSASPLLCRSARAPHALDLHHAPAAHRGGRLPRHGAQRGPPAGLDVLSPAARGPVRGRQCYVLDPMLATGGSSPASIRLLLESGATDITAICLLAAPEGIKTLEGPDSGACACHRRHAAMLMSASTRWATSSRGSAMPATGCTASRTDLTPQL